MVQSNSITLDNGSVVADRYFIGSGDERFMTKEGYSYAMNYLYHKAIKAGVSFEFDACMQALYEDGRVVINGNTIAPDKIVVAISPFGYKNLTTDIDGLLSNAKLCSGRNGDGIDVTKYAIVVDKIVDVGQIYFALGEAPYNNIYGFIYSAPQPQNLLYVLSYNQKSHYKNKDPRELKQDVVQSIAKHVEKAWGSKANVIEWSAFDTHSWALSEVGFNPMKSIAGASMVHVGAISGTSDSVHSVMTGTCISLGVDDPHSYMVKLFGDAHHF